MCTVLLAMRVQVSLNHLEPMLYNGVNNKSLTGLYNHMKNIKQCPNVWELSMNSFLLIHTCESTAQVKPYQTWTKNIEPILNLNTKFCIFKKMKSTAAIKCKLISERVNNKHLGRFLQITFLYIILFIKSQNHSVT